MPKRQVKTLGSVGLDVFFLTLDGLRHAVCEAGAVLKHALGKAGLAGVYQGVVLPTETPVAGDKPLLQSCVIDLRPVFQQDALLPGCSDTQVWHALQQLVEECTGLMRV